MSWPQRLVLYAMGIGCFMVTGSLLSAAAHSTDPGRIYLLSGLAAVSLALICGFLGYRLGVVARVVDRPHARITGRENEQAILTAAITLAGNLAQADLGGTSGPLTEDEQRLIEAVAHLLELPAR